MLFRYRGLVAEPRVWDAMTAHDCDVVPQPVRALAFRHMAAFWSGYYRLGAEHGITPRAAADAVAALLMTESWFEHRAVNVNRWGNRDLGLAQAADTTRARMVRLYRAGVVDVLFLEEEDYFDPWKATRFAVLWLRLLHCPVTRQYFLHPVMGQVVLVEQLKPGDSSWKPFLRFILSRRDSHFLDSSQEDVPP